MDELIVFLLFGWMELLVKPGKNTGGFVVAWIFVVCVGVGSTPTASNPPPTGLRCVTELHPGNYVRRPVCEYNTYQG